VIGPEASSAAASWAKAGTEIAIALIATLIVASFKMDLRINYPFLGTQKTAPKATA
jgi:hypothetical protein